MTNDRSSSNKAPGNNPGPTMPNRQGTGSLNSLVDAVYEVALDPSRYDELVEQWHSELTLAAHSEKDRGAELSEHFQRAVTILQRIERSDWQPTENLTENSAAMPEVLLSRSGRVVSSNPGATALLSARVGHPLTSLDLAPSACELLREHCAGLKTTARSPYESAQPDNTPKLLRISRSGDDKPLVVLLGATIHQSKPVLALRCAEIVWPESLGPLLAKAFGLTDAECQIVQHLVAGQNTAQIAEARGTSRETVRTQINQLLSKTATHSQLELVRMAIGFSMMSQHAEARALGTGKGTKSEVAGSAQSVKSRIKQLSSEAQIELVEYGPESGPPVLVFHDEVIGDAFVLPLLRLLPAYRWLIAVRPGYGASSWCTTDADDRYAATLDFNQALEALAPNLSAMPLLAHGNGIFFACQFASAFPDKCISITTLAGSLPGDRGEQDSSRYAAFFDGMGRLAPSMLNFAAQAGFAMYARVGPKRFLQRVYSNCEADRKVLASDRNIADLEHGGRLTLAQGYRGFLRDEEMLIGDWSKEFLATPVPIKIVLGDQDQPDRRYRAEKLHGESNTVEIVHAERCGFFAAFSRPQLVSETLLRA